jgi:hypothetical protein
MPASTTTAASDARDDFFTAPLRGLATAAAATPFNRRQRAALGAASSGVDLDIDLSSLRTRDD